MLPTVQGPEALICPTHVGMNRDLFQAEIFISDLLHLCEDDRDMTSGSVTLGPAYGMSDSSPILSVIVGYQNTYQ